MKKYVWLGLFLLGFSLHAKLPDDLQGSLLVVSKEENAVSFIDIASGETRASLPTGRGPHELIVSDDGNWAVVSDFVGGNSLTIIDVAAQKVARTIKLRKYPRPHGIHFLKEQHLVVATSGPTGHLVIADIHTGEVVKAVNTTQFGPHMVTVDKPRQLAFSSNMRSHSLSVIDLSNNTFLRKIDTAQTPEAIKLNHTGDELWYGANKQGLVKALNTKTGQELAEFSGFAFPYRVLFTSDDKLAMVPDFRNDYVRFFDAKNKTELGTLDLGKGAGPQGVILHPNDKLLFLSLNRQHKIAVIDVHSRQVIAEFASGRHPDGIGYTPLTYGSPQD